MPFQKGQIPWNKNLKGSNKPNRTSFKKGFIPWNKGLKTGLIPKTAFKKGHPANPKSQFKKGHIPFSKLHPELMPTPWNKGTKGICKPNSGSFKKGMIPLMGMKGKKLSEESKLKMSLAHKGEKSHLWNGGITPLMHSIRNCFKYRQWRFDVFTKDNFICQNCGDNQGGNLNADHYPKAFSTIIQKNNIKTLEEALNCEELWNILNGKTLCINCHKKTETFGRRIYNYGKVNN